MSAPSPCHVTQTPQREFAGAKLQQIFEIRKYLLKNRLRKIVFAKKTALPSLCI